MNKRLESVLEFCNNNNYTIREYIDTGGVRVTHANGEYTVLYQYKGKWVTREELNKIYLDLKGGLLKHRFR